MHSSCVRLPTCSDTLFQSSLYISSACGGDSHTRSSRRAREAPSPALLSRLPRGSLACDTHVPRQAQGESPSSTWKGQGLTKRPQSLPGTGPGAGSRETGRITPSPLPSAAGTLAAPSRRTLPLPARYLQEQQGLLLRPLASGAGCGFALHRNAGGSAGRAAALSAKGAPTSPPTTPNLGGHVLLRVHVRAQPEVLHVRRFLLAFVGEAEHLLGSGVLLFVEGKERGESE